MSSSSARSISREYINHRPPYQYKLGVLLDMVGDTELQLYVERKSAQFAPQLVKELWTTAAKLGVREFVYQPNHDLSDDHIPLNEIARIPTVDIIDFDFPYWHTEQDAPPRCSPLSLAKVGWVVQEWLKVAVR